MSDGFGEEDHVRNRRSTRSRSASSQCSTSSQPHFVVTTPSGQLWQSDFAAELRHLEDMQRVQSVSARPRPVRLSSGGCRLRRHSEPSFEMWQAWRYSEGHEPARQQTAPQLPVWSGARRRRRTESIISAISVTSAGRRSTRLRASGNFLMGMCGTRSLSRGSISSLHRLDSFSRRCRSSEGTPSSVGARGPSSMPSKRNPFGSPERADRACRRSTSGSPISERSGADSKTSRRSCRPPRLSFSSVGSRGRASALLGHGESWNHSPCGSVMSPMTVSQLLRLRRVCISALDTHSKDFALFRASVLASRLCAAMVDSEIVELAQRTEVFFFSAGDRVVEPDDFGSHFFVVREGHFTLRFCSEDDPCDDVGRYLEPLPSYRLGPGDTFGELAVLHGEQQRIFVQAEDSPVDVALGGFRTRHPAGKDIVASCWGIERRLFNMLLRRMAERVYRENLALLDRVRFFQYLSQRQRRIVCRTAVVQLFDAGKRVTTEGAQGLENTDCLFIVKSGSLDVSVGEQHVTRLKYGDEFGERAWLYSEPRPATVTAMEPSAVLVVRRDVLEQELGDHFKDLSWRNVIHSVMRDFLDYRDFVELGSPTLKAITDAFIIRSYPPKSDIIKDDDQLGLRFIVVLNGEVWVRCGDEPVLRLGRGRVFGEDYLLNPTVEFRHTVENLAEEPCVLAVLSRDAVSALSAWRFGEELSLQQKMELMRKVHIFRHLTQHHCLLVAETIRTVRKARGDDVVKQGEIGSQFFIIKSGEVSVSIGGQVVRTLGKSDYFGERGLMSDEPRSATVTVQSLDAEFLVIDKVVFKHIVHGKLLELMVERIRLQDPKLKLHDLQILRTLGHGTCGVVKLVEHRSLGHRYALKCISIAKSISTGQQEALKLEREILLENDHPFIVKVVRTFKDQKYLYFLTELVTGGELYKLMRDVGFLTKSQVQFYAGGLILALESLHERCIAFRDLKPENVLLDSQGFTKLIDFGCAKKLTGHTFTLVGTPHYIAPEVIMGWGYGLSCDVWSFGVCLYELICGPLPFGACTEEPVEVFRELLTAKLSFPQHAKSDKTATHLMRVLLKRPLENRLGYGRGTCWRSVRKDPYFKNFSFDRLLSRQLEPPVIPTETVFGSSGSEAASDFDDTTGNGAESDEAEEEGEGVRGHTAVSGTTQVRKVASVPQVDEADCFADF